MNNRTKKELIQEPRSIRQALFRALEEANLTAYSVSEASGVGNALLSKFKTNSSLNYTNLQKVIDCLPEEVFARFVELLQDCQRKNDPPKVSNNQIVLELRQIARQYAANREERYDVSVSRSSPN
jgi:predicted transcriptional regulator